MIPALLLIIRLSVFMYIIITFDSDILSLSNSIWMFIQVRKVMDTIVTYMLQYK